MCIILPVDHITCTHTIAIWQHCVNAPKTKRHSLAPCQRIRQHARPILTRKLCINCGGPRFFARRGGIAERGWQTAETISEREEKSSGEESDAEYDSDVIMEEDEDDLDLAISPRGSIATVRAGRSKKSKKDEETRRTRRDMSSHRSRSRGPSWKPNLKKELTRETFSAYGSESIDSRTAFYTDDVNDQTRYSSSSSQRLSTGSAHSSRPIRRPTLPALDTGSGRPAFKRKTSTLLHPSTPSDGVPAAESDDETLLSPRRKASTLLHPSTPPPDNSTAHEDQNESFRPTSFLTTNSSPISFAPPPRKGSTLLHPSTPNDDVPEDGNTTFPFSLPTPPSSSHSANFNPATLNIIHAPYAKRKPSIIHSSLLTAEPDSGSSPEYSESEYSSSGSDNATSEEEHAYHVSPTSATGPGTDESFRHMGRSISQQRAKGRNRQGVGAPHTMQEL